MNIKTIGEMNEKSFLKEIVSKYAQTAKTIEFDDCIVVDLSDILQVENLPYLVYSIDHPSFINRPLEEELKYKFYGRWVAAITCGDVLAMGAKPKGFSIDIAAPLETEIFKLEYILQGLRDILDIYGTIYEGGNFDSNILELVGMAWGIVEKDKIIRRAGAKEGDFIAVTTTLGYGWADYISRKLNKTSLLTKETQYAFQNFKILPAAPCKAILAAVDTKGITSGMDLSDGIIEFLYTIKEKNQLGTRIYEEWIAITPEMQEVAKRILNIRPGLLALEAGYDTPLGHAYTVAPNKWDEVSAAFERNDAKLYKIGLVEKSDDIILQTINNTTHEIPPFWDDQFNKMNVVERWNEMIKYF